MARTYVGFYSLLVLAGSVLVSWPNMRLALGVYLLVMAVGVLADGITDKFRTVTYGSVTVPADWVPNE